MGIKQVFAGSLLAILTASAIGAIGAAGYRQATRVLPAAVDRSKLEPLYRSARATQAGVGVGLNIGTYSTLLQSMATEATIASDRATTEKEKAIIASYVAALSSLNDAQTIWERKIDRNASGFIRIEDDVRELVSRYNLKIYEDGVYADEAMQAIWAKAGEQTDAATKLYYER